MSAAATAGSMAAGDGTNRTAITVSMMLATMMASLDSTIANVALPHMQGSVSASQDQITWVLTSYIVAAAIMTPLTGWLASRFGRKILFLVSIAGFTVASMLCGVAQNLAEIVAFRLLQGLFGAALIPMSQAVLLDINPPEKHGQAMAVWGAGAILGPILGPALGGWLTEHMSWRWVFFINLPVGVLAYLGVQIFLGGNRHDQAKPFDFLGFGALVVFIGALQMFLDRGPGLDWFGSTEIWVELIIAAIAFWVFCVHTATAARPFFDRALLKDRNFLTANAFGFILGILLFATLALLPPMLEGLLGYPVVTTGLVTMPRGVGTFLAMFVVGRLIGRVDTRLILFTGLCFNAVSLWIMCHFSLLMTSHMVVYSGLLQGFGIGLLFVSLSTLAFATLNPIYRGEGSSVFTLVRNMGSSAGISVLQALQVTNTQAAHSGLAGAISPENTRLQMYLPKVFDLHSSAGLAALDGEISRQAGMIAYLDDFRLMLFITVAVAPLLLLLRVAKGAPSEPAHAVLD